MINDKMNELLNKVMHCLDGLPSAIGCAVLGDVLSMLISDVVINSNFKQTDIDGLLNLIKERANELVNKHNKHKPNFEINQ